MWDKIKEFLRTKIDAASYELYISQLEPVKVEENEIIISAPNVCYSDWFEKNCKKLVKDFIKEESNCDLKISYVYEEKPEQTFEQITQSQNKKQKMASQFNQKYTFENFVIGPNNRFAYSIAYEVAESPGKRYNPVFIYGGVGLGKTHLLHAIGNKILASSNNINVRYTSCESFITEYVDSVRSSRVSEFRQKYEEVDCLLVDDIHQLIGKEQTQEAFFFLFNNLYNAKKQIVITSDRSILNLVGLHERLLNRFEMGVTADISPPDYEIRVAILEKKCELESYDVPKDVINFIAQVIQRDVRKLEGALINLVAYSTAYQEPITIDLAKIVLKEAIQKEKEKEIITIEKIMKVISKHYNVSVKDLKSNKRTRNIALPRQIGMYLAEALTDSTTSLIAQEFGNRDHSAVSHAVKKIKSKIETTPSFANEINKIIQELKE